MNTRNLDAKLLDLTEELHTVRTILTFHPELATKHVLQCLTLCELELAEAKKSMTTARGAPLAHIGRGVRA